MKYESNVLDCLVKTYGVIGNPKYVSEIIKQFIIQGKECYPNLFTYQGDWLAHIDEFGLTPEYTVSYTGQHIYAPNTMEKPVKRAILKGNTGYRDIDTGEILETFEEGRNLELVSVKMPVLTTSNEDGTKTNILTVNEDVELRGIGDVQDTLDLMTGELTENFIWLNFNGVSKNFNVVGDLASNVNTGFTRIWVRHINEALGKNTMNTLLPTFNFEYNENSAPCECITYRNNGSGLNIIIKTERLGVVNQGGAVQWLEENMSPILCQLKNSVVKTVDLTIHDKDHQKVERLTSFDGGTHFITSSQNGSLQPSIIVDVVTDLEKTLMVCSLEGNTM